METLILAIWKRCAELTALRIPWPAQPDAEKSRKGDRKREQTERGMVGGAEWRETRPSRGPPCLPQTSLQGPGDLPVVWAAVAGDSSEGWLGWDEGQVKDFKRNIIFS